MKKMDECKNTFPDMLDFKKVYLNRMIYSFVIILALIIFFSFAGQVLESLLYLGSFFIFLIFANRIEIIKSNIIRKADIVLKENSTYIISKASFKDILLGNGVYYTRNGRTENGLRIISFISIIVFFKYIGNHPQNNFYLTWVFSFLIFTLFLFYSANNIYVYFYKLIESSFKIKSFREYCESVSFQKDSILPIITRYIKKLKSLFILTVILVSVNSLIFIYFDKHLPLTSLPVVFIVMLGIVTLDINNIVKTSIPILGDYDRYIKDKFSVKKTQCNFPQTSKKLI